MSVRCIHYRERGCACLHEDAPQGVLLLPKCILVVQQKDPRIKPGCQLQEQWPNLGDKPQGPPNQRWNPGAWGFGT